MRRVGNLSEQKSSHHQTNVSPRPLPDQPPNPSSPQKYQYAENLSIHRYF